ncbi:MAG: M48 family metallopeptidase [Verrucomicrobiales bacterium]
MAMDFFEAQDQAQRRTRWLWLWFLLGVIGVVAAVELLVWLLFYGGKGFDPAMWLWGGGTAALILLSSGYKSMMLSGGGDVLARELGGRLVDPHSRDTEERRLLNVVEEMAIASGLPVPQVFLMDEEMSINAFAAGTEPSNAVIGVTRGCVQRLSRDELQGVVAHEFSHILNGDMKMNMRLTGMVFGLMVITLVGRMVFEAVAHGAGRVRRSDREGGSAALAFLLFGIGLLVIGSIGTFFGRMIQAAISRQREYLADASAVQFTRNPDGLAGALKKIGGLSGPGARIQASRAGEASHLFFADLGLFGYGLATHPPLDKRISALLGEWSGKWEESALPQLGEGRDAGGRVPAGAALSGLASGSGLGDAARVRAEAGRRIQAVLPADLQDAAREREGAQTLIFGLLLASDEKLRGDEVRFLGTQAGPVARDLALQWHDRLAGAHSAEKIALMDLAMPALRRMSGPEYERFTEITRWLIASDAQVDLFEFMMQKVVARHLGSHFEGVRRERMRYHELAELAQEANVLVSTVAGVGARGREELEAAYERAVGPWREAGWWRGSLAEPMPLNELAGMMEKFRQANPLVKRDFLEACARAAAADGDLTSREAEILRALADCIACSLPPFVEELDWV